MSLFQGNEGAQGMLSGAAAGASFGPIGAVIGGVAGLFGGRKAKKKRKEQERQQLIANTGTAYDIGEATTGSIRQQRNAAVNEYASNVSSNRARMAAAGGGLSGGSFDAVNAGFAAQRDTALGEADIARDKYENTDAYKFLKDDYNYMTQSGGVGRSGESFYSDTQRSDLRGYSGESTYMGGKMTEYNQSITPTMEEYEQLRFGSDSERARMEETIGSRITEANKVYDEAMIMNQLSEEQKRQSGSSL